METKDCPECGLECVVSTARLCTACGVNERWNKRLDELEVLYDARGHRIAALEGHVKRLRRALETITVPCDCGYATHPLSVSVSHHDLGHTEKCSIVITQSAVHSVSEVAR
ncbi:MAG: hypothetical protein UY96_C0003G0063 [Parcubacteria group bacterium GW2011_GWB1_56_8]|nr:MAG: hypothetical protein UY96_C0003G0063 [Parcubacteria group bacterium GW2011_GWB1_56_8]